jgi:penicillin-binding protein 1C
VRIGDDRAPRIQFPLNGSRLDVTAEGEAKMSPLAVKVSGGVPPMTVLVNGLSAGELDGRRQRFVEPPGPGFVRLTVMDATGAADTVVVRLQ